MDGLGLVDADTVISEKKRTVQVAGRLDGTFLGTSLTSDVTGYEIHMGVTQFNQDYPPLVRLDNGEIDGVCLEDGLVMGTYLHGIFDNVEPRKTILDTIRRQKGLNEGTIEESFSAFKERQYDALAELLETHLNMDALECIMNGGEVSWEK
jgi:adenosylcobyric acid synthase